MRWSKRLKAGARLVMAFLLVVSLGAMVGLTGLASIALASGENLALSAGSEVFAPVGLVAALGVGGLLGWWITRSIALPQHDGANAAQATASAASHVEAESRDEMAHLLRAMRDMDARLLEVTFQLRKSRDAIATGSAQISAVRRAAMPAANGARAGAESSATQTAAK